VDMRTGKRAVKGLVWCSKEATTQRWGLTGARTESRPVFGACNSKDRIGSLTRPATRWPGCSPEVLGCVLSLRRELRAHRGLEDLSVGRR